MGRFAFGIGRAVGKHPAAGWIFCATERLLPLKRIARTNSLVAFHHPKPVADHHILIVPIKPISGLMGSHTSNARIHELLLAVANLAHEVATETDSEAAWQIVINGGSRQEIGQLHAHLLKDDALVHHAGLALHDPENWPVLESQLREAHNDTGSGYSLIIQGIEGSRPRAHISLTSSNV